MYTVCQLFVKLVTVFVFIYIMYVLFAFLYFLFWSIDSSLRLRVHPVCSVTFVLLSALSCKVGASEMYCFVCAVHKVSALGLTLEVKQPRLLPAGLFREVTVRPHMPSSSQIQ